eukprot:scaffold4980_cov323-Prasinococcus_capsulatus_cf.AAC.3
MAAPRGADEEDAVLRAYGGFGALIFDCDGTVVDTMPFFFWANERAAAEQGVRLTRERFYELAGMPIRDIFRAVAAEQGAAAADEERFLAAKARLAPQCPHRVTLVEPVRAIYERLHGRVPMAVASSGMRVNVEKHLKECGVFGAPRAAAALAPPLRTPGRLTGACARRAARRRVRLQSCSRRWCAARTCRAASPRRTSSSRRRRAWASTPRAAAPSRTPTRYARCDRSQAARVCVCRLLPPPGAAPPTVDAVLTRICMLACLLA